jgi:hypothetical protein
MGLILKSERMRGSSVDPHLSLLWFTLCTLYYFCVCEFRWWSTDSVRAPYVGTISYYGILSNTLLGWSRR